MHKLLIKKSKVFCIMIIINLISAPITLGISNYLLSNKNQGQWQVGTYGTYTLEPPGSGINYLYANCSPGEEASFITPALDLSDCTFINLNYSISFAGTGVAAIGTYSGGIAPCYYEETLFFAHEGVNPFTETHELLIDISSYSYKQQVFIEFYYFSSYGNNDPPGLAIDDIEVFQADYFEGFEINNGNLFGYVTDPMMNPIEGALVRVYFHGTYEENYSDENGFYHVTNIPLCWCMKNCTCSKDGYASEWVLMAITENTTYDFTLFPLFPYPVLNGSYCNGWWNSPVTVTFIYDPEEVAEIWYYYRGWNLYTEPYVIDENGEFELECYWVDYNGQHSSHDYFIIPFDQQTPSTNLTWETYKELGIWYVKFTLVAEDDISGMSPYLEFYLDDVLQGEFEVVWPVFKFEMQWNKNYENANFGFICSDNACNSAMEEVNGSEIESFNKNYNQNHQDLHNSVLLRIINFMKKIETKNEIS